VLENEFTVVVNWREPDAPGEILSSDTGGEVKEKAGTADVLTVSAMLAVPLTVPVEPVNGLV
jgi:hypothetical protein